MFLFALVMLHMSRPQACHRMTRVQREYMRWLMIQPEKFSHPCWIHKLMILTKGWAPGTVLQPLYLCLHGTLFNRNTLPNPMTKSRYVCGAGIPSLPIGTSLNWVVALDRALCVSLCVTLCLPLRNLSWLHHHQWTIVDLFSDSIRLTFPARWRSQTSRGHRVGSLSFSASDVDAMVQTQIADHLWIMICIWSLVALVAPTNRFRTVQSVHSSWNSGKRPT